MWGSGLSRPAATYNAYRALFLLLQSGPYQSARLSSPAGRGRNRSAAAVLELTLERIQITTRRRGHQADLPEVAAPQPKGRWRAVPSRLR
jgi:hypothetical protein